MVFKIAVNGILIKSCCVLILIFHSQFTTAHVINLYSDIDQRGTEEKVDISRCSNLPTTILDQVSSINTHKACARLFDGPNCTGNSIEVFLNSPSHYSLVPWNFNDMTKSAGPCRDSCDAEVTGAPLKDGESLDLEIFSDTDQKGLYAHLKVGGCSIIPIAFRQRVVSVITFGRCFNLYNNIECLHHGENIEHIELRPGVPTAFYNNLQRWGLTKFKAVSPCGYKCNKNSTSVATTSSYITSQNESDVILFESRNFRGNLKRFLVKECVNAGNEWEGVAVSIRTFFDTCVSLYDRRNCEGKSLNITASNGDLSNDHFSQVTRSLRLCTNSNRKRDSVLETSGNHFNNDSKNLPLPNAKKINSNPAEESAINSNHCSVSIIIIVVSAAILVVVVIAVFVFLAILGKKYLWRFLQARISKREIQEVLLGTGEHSDPDHELNYRNDVNLGGGFATQNEPYNQHPSVTN